MGRRRGKERPPANRAYGLKVARLKAVVDEPDPHGLRPAGWVAWGDADTERADDVESGPSSISPSSAAMAERIWAAFSAHEVDELLGHGGCGRSAGFGVREEATRVLEGAEGGVEAVVVKVLGDGLVEGRPRRGCRP